MDLLSPKEIEIDGKTYILSKFPAVQGREIVAKYPTSALPKLGDYSVSEETMLKLMCYVAVMAGGQELRLKTRDLVNNHVPSWEVLAKIEMAMMEYNCSFFQNASLSTFLVGVVQSTLAKITETLTQTLAQSSMQEKQPSTNSEQSTL